MKNVIVLICLLIIISGCTGISNNKKNESNMNDQLQTLIDKDKLTEVVNQLFISTDNKDWLKVKELFSSEVLFDTTSITGGDPVTLTPQEIVDSWEKGLKPLKAVHHQAGNYVVNIKQNEAEVFCYGIATHYLPNKTNKNTRTFVGSYNLHMINNGGKWEIDKFKFNLKYIDGNIYLEETI